MRLALGSLFLIKSQIRSQALTARTIRSSGGNPFLCQSKTCLSAILSPVSSTSVAATTKEKSGKTNKQKMIHFNHAGASPSPPFILERMQEHTKLEREIGGYAAAALVQEEVDQVYNDIANFIHGKNSNEIALTESATVSWTRIFYAVVQKHQLQNQAINSDSNKNDKNNDDNNDDDDPNENIKRNTKNVILISEAEYAANVVAACQWAKDYGWTVLAIPSTTTNNNKTKHENTNNNDENDDGTTSTGIVDLNVLDSMLGGTYKYKDHSCNNGITKTRILDPSQISIICITHIPTNSGIVNPVQDIGERIAALKEKDEKYKDIFYLVDSCQSVGHLDVNVQEIKCDALVATGRKYLRGPRGTGFLYVSSNYDNHNNLMPSHIDHYGCPVTRVPSNYPQEDGDYSIQNILDFAPRHGAKRFEFWESNIANRIGLGLAIQEAMKKGSMNIENDCKRISKQLRDALECISPSIKIHHANSTTCGIVTFYSTNVDSETIVQKLLQNGFGLSVVPATSTPLDSSKTKVPNLVRASISYMTTLEEIDALCKALSTILNTKVE